MDGASRCERHDDAHLRWVDLVPRSGAPEAEPKLVMEAISGPIYFRVLSCELIDDEFINGIVDLALTGVGRS